MNKIKNIPLKILFPCLIGLAILSILLLSSGLLTWMLRNKTVQNASEKIQVSATNVGNILAETINNSGQVVRIFTDLVEQTVSDNIVTNELKREFLISEMRKLVEKNRLSNLWCTFEPNALDGLDSLFISRLGSNSRGIFAPFVLMKYGEIQMVVYEDDYSEDYYIQPKEQMTEVVTSPYLDEESVTESYLFSFCIPLILQGHLIGVAGTDLSSDDIMKKFRDVNLHQTKGRLISSEGIIVVDTDSANIGKLVDREIMDKMSSKQLFEGLYQVDGEEVYKVFVPVTVGNKHWYFEEEMSKAVIYEWANSVRINMMIFNAICIVILILIVFFILRTLFSRIERLTECIHQMSFGRLSFVFDKNLGNNEVDRMSSELEILTKALQRTADFAKEIGEGNFEIDFEPLSNEDVFGNSLIEMRDNLRRMNKEEMKYKRKEKYRNWVLQEIQYTNNFDESLHHILKQILTFTQFDSIMLTNWEQDDDLSHRAIAYNSFETEDKNGNPLPIEICRQWSNQTKADLAVMYNASQLPDYVKPYFASTPVNLVCAFPLISRDETLGIFVIAKYNNNQSEVEFGHEELIFIQSITQIIATSIEKEIVKKNLIRAKEKAEESDKLKSAFLANMSHEIRTPMNAIIGFASLMDKDDINPQQVKYNQIIDNNCKILLQLMDDILDISKLESRQMKIFPTICNIDHLMFDLLLIYRQMVIKKGKNNVEIILEEGNFDKPVFLDTVRLRQVLNNLVNNAIKFTDKGYISFGYQCVDDKNLQFTITDTGIGIPKKYKEVIFKRFRQIEEHNSRNIGGTGIGLAISKNLVELMGGRMWFESEENYGSTFHFVLPIEYVKEA